MLDGVEKVVDDDGAHGVELEIALRCRRRRPQLSSASTWIAIITMASHWVGLTLPGMMEQPGSLSGSLSSPMPQRGPEASQRMSLAIFISATARPRSAP